MGWKINFLFFFQKKFQFGSGVDFKSFISFSKQNTDKKQKIDAYQQEIEYLCNVRFALISLFFSTFDSTHPRQVEVAVRPGEMMSDAFLQVVAGRKSVGVDGDGEVFAEVASNSLELVADKRRLATSRLTHDHDRLL